MVLGRGIQSTVESTTSLLSDDTSDDGQVTEMIIRDTKTKKPTSNKSPVVLHYIKNVSKKYNVPAYS